MSKGFDKILREFEEKILVLECPAFVRTQRGTEYQGFVSGNAFYYEDKNGSTKSVPLSAVADNIIIAGKRPSSIKQESAPEGWEGTVKAMKSHKEIDNPWALAHYMKNKGYKSHNETIESVLDELELQYTEEVEGGSGKYGKPNYSKAKTDGVGAKGKQATHGDKPNNYLKGQKLVGGG